MIGNLKPLLSVGVETAEMVAGQVDGTRVTEHGYQGRICVLEDSKTVAAADAVWGIHDQGAEVAFGSAQTLLGGAESGVEPADQERDREEERQMRNRSAILGRRLISRERVVGAHGEREGSCGQAGLPSAIPRTDHHRDR